MCVSLCVLESRLLRCSIPPFEWLVPCADLKAIGCVVRRMITNTKQTNTEQQQQNRTLKHTHTHTQSYYNNIILCIHVNIIGGAFFSCRAHNCSKCDTQ